MNSQPTRFDKRCGVKNLLDLIIESDTDKLFHSVRTMSVTFSDHCLVTARLRVKRPPAALVTFSYRDIKNINLFEFRTQLARSKLIVSPSSDPDECMSQFEADVKAALDQCAPLRIFTKRGGNVLNR